MFLKRLEINGFKSFAQKTVFEFPTGIVGIVGPNGSGKSNVIDAVRWLLGEREAKNLRGGKIEDLIFAGTPKRARSGMAHVSLVFDNVDGRLPVDFKEVVISRKINRSGESDYAINDAAVRLKDIIEFFTKIKLGTKGLTIIGQGSADMFVKALPVQRMMMVQEILGLREYQVKKNEAQRKLKHTATNIEKVTAMMQEVAPRLRMLKRQTAKWEKRFDVDKELNELEYDYIAFKIKTLEQSRASATEPLARIKHEYEKTLKALKEVEAHLEAIEKQSVSSAAIQKVQEEKRTLFAHRAEVERRLYKIEALIERLSEETPNEATLSITQARSALSHARQKMQEAARLDSLSEIKKIINEVVRAIDGLFETKKETTAHKEHESLKKEKDELEKEIVRMEARLTELEEQEKTLSAGIDDFSRTFKETFAQAEELRQTLSSLNEQKSRSELECEKIAFKLDELKHQVVSAQKEWRLFEQRAADPSFVKAFTEDELLENERRIMRLRGELASIGDIDESLVKETHEVEAHYEFLTKESKDLEEATANLNVLITNLNEKIETEFRASFKKVNDEFNSFFRLMFGGGSAHMKIIEKERAALMEDKAEKEGQEDQELTIADVGPSDTDDTLSGIEVTVSIPQKKITSLEMLSGGEKTLVSLAVLFALIAVSPPPFLILDEADSALDEKNSKRFADLVKQFAKHTQFLVVTHNRVTMEAAQVLYGVTMDDTGSSKVLSMKLGE